MYMHQVQDLEEGEELLSNECLIIWSWGGSAHLLVSESRESDSWKVESLATSLDLWFLFIIIWSNWKRRITSHYKVV